MSAITVEPATSLAFDPVGTPFSPLYSDVYRSRDGALAESQAVFIEGTQLAARWANLRSSTLLEIGFCLVVNFLATLSAWRSSAHRPERLHVVSIEKHPLRAADLAAAHDALGIEASDGKRLCEQWPPLTPDLHRLSFAEGRVTLWLALGDAELWLPRLRLAADAVYLDGFAPSRNAGAWSDPVIRGVARLSRPGAQLATFTAARSVADRLRSAGFDVTLRPGHGRKRERIDAIYQPRWRTWPAPPPLPHLPDRSAMIIGAGISGTAIASRLAEDGWKVRLVDEASGPLQGGSAQPLCADHLHVSPDDNLMARASRAALHLARAARQRQGRSALSEAEGRLQIAGSDAESEQMRATIARLGFPSEFVRFVDRHEASELSGLALPRGGLWLAACQLIDPTQLAHERLTASYPGEIAASFHRRVERLVREDSQWAAYDSRGELLARAEVAILANAGDAVRLGGLHSLPMRRIRGQSSWLKPTHPSALRCVLGGPAYAAPATQRWLIGATYDEADPNPAPATCSDQSNLKRFARMVGVDAPDQIGTVTPAAVGFRWTATDRMPLIGALPDEAAADREASTLLRNARLPLPRLSALHVASGFGSRGSLWSELAAEMLLSELTGGPCPIAAELATACDPGRQWRRYRTR